MDKSQNAAAPEIINNLLKISEMPVCNRTAWTAINFAKAAIATLEASNASIQAEERSDDSLK